MPVVRAEWPQHTSHLRAWKQQQRAGSREDRMFAEVSVSLPPMIAQASYRLDPAQAEAVAAATRTIMLTDLGWGERLSALGRFLIRNESVASSKIELVEAETEDFARALVGVKSDSSASAMVGATLALSGLVNDVSASSGISREGILAAHRSLMLDDPVDGRFAGQFRPMQNWIGGSDYSPRGAVYVPPPPETVADYLDDLLRYASRTDVEPLVQATVVHAQFESIHPFTDGNGRIGRALINAVLRRRRVTTTTVVPIASAIVADTSRYFQHLGDYRRGDLAPILDEFVTSSAIAASESRHSAGILLSLPDEWAGSTRARAGSATASILGQLLDHPVLTLESATRFIDASETALYAAFDRLEADGVLREITGRKRNRVWAASAVLDELDDLAVRIAAATRRANSAEF